MFPVPEVALVNVIIIDALALLLQAPSATAISSNCTLPAIISSAEGVYFGLSVLVSVNGPDASVFHVNVVVFNTSELEKV